MAAKKASTSRKRSSSKSSAKKSSPKRSSAKKSSSKKRGSGKRELIDTGNDKRFVRRDGKGQFSEVDNVSRSLSADSRQKAKTKTKSGQGDRGDRKR